MLRRLFKGFLVSALLIVGTGIPAYAQSPDLDGDGNIGFRDFILFSQNFQLFARQGGAGFDATIDFDRNGVIQFEDYLIFAVNFGRSGSNISLTLPSEPGANSGASAYLDLDAGDEFDGGDEEGTVSGEGTIFSVELFTDEIVSPVSGIHAIFNIDPSKLKVVGVKGAQGLSVMGQPVSTGFVLGALTGFTPGPTWYVATVDFQTVTDVTGM
ncbi:MAG: hypothetical protein O2954_10335, partial [bacterium]|nr:hypothetical protein [bacterium]